MRPGAWAFTLRQGTSQTTIDAIRAGLGWTGDPDNWDVSDGHIVVTPVPMTLDTVTLAHSIYTGRLLTQTDRRSFSGDGLAGWFGSASYPGPIRATKLTATQDLEDWVDDIVATGTTGITKGTVTDSATTYESEWHYTTCVEMLDEVCAALEREWRVNPDGTLDAGLSTSLFVDDPTVLIGDLTTGLGGVRGLRGRIANPAIDSGQRTSRVHAIGAGEGAAATIYTTTKRQVARNISGGNPNLDRMIDAPQNQSPTKLGDVTHDAYEYPRFDLSLDIADRRPRDLVAPGDNVYVYDPSAGIVGQTLLETRGQVLYPVAIRVQQLAWPVANDHGVYLRRHDGTRESWLDLTKVIQPESGGSQVGVGGGFDAPVDLSIDPLPATGPIFSIDGPATIVVSDGGTGLADRGVSLAPAARF